MCLLLFRSLQKSKIKTLLKDLVALEPETQNPIQVNYEGFFTFARKPCMLKPRLGWVIVEDLDDLSGPLVLIVNEENPHVLSFSENGKTTANPCDSPFSFEPGNVAEVLVGKTILPGIFSLKTAFSRYFSSDTVGSVFATREAIGPTETWTPVKGENGRIAFRNASHKYLSVDPTNFVVRADAEDIGPNELFTVKCQAAEHYKRLQAATPKSVPEQKVDPNKLEEEEFRKFHAYARDTSGLPSADLDHALQEGRLREALLDRRVKAKHDKFC